MTVVRPRVLCVDDEQRVLDGLTRTLRADFDVEHALNGHDALARLVHEEFAVVLSDLRMPGMDGATFLGHAAEVAPSTVRVLLTGHTDVDDAIQAVNRGRIFRFLTKPASFDDLNSALHDAVAQHELITAERVLLEQTLRGAVTAMLEALSLSNPLVFARATRIRRIVAALLTAFPVADGWAIEIAAALSQLGAVSLPVEVVAKLDCGTPLTAEQQELMAGLPALTEQLLASIPRFDTVRDAIRLQNENFDPAKHLPLGARLLRVAIDLDQLESLNFTRAEAAAVLAERDGRYDPEVVQVLADLAHLEELDVNRVPHTVRAAMLRPGMVLARDVVDTNGVLLVGRGTEVTPGLIARITNAADRVGTEIWVSGIVQPRLRLVTNKAGAAR
jgi:response regulator RpfG family c-di-GMP phosphodiesterase